jgi:hypothetical protein
LTKKEKEKSSREPLPLLDRMLSSSVATNKDTAARSSSITHKRDSPAPFLSAVSRNSQHQRVPLYLPSSRNFHITWQMLYRLMGTPPVSSASPCAGAATFATSSVSCSSTLIPLCSKLSFTGLPA